MRILFVSMLLLGAVAFADTVTLQDGRTVNGSYLGGDSRSIKIAVGDRIETYSVSDVRNISFGDVVAPPVLRNRPTVTLVPGTPSVSAQPTPAPAQAPRQMAAQREIAPGTTMEVRLIDDVDSERDQVGKSYRATLNEPINDAAGNTVVPRGADMVVKLVNDQESGKLQGKTILTLDVVSMKVDGRDVPIDTANVTQESGSRTGRSAKVIGGTAVLGTIIGAIAGGGKGAAIGAAAGAGAGTGVQVLTKGQRVRIPSETILNFTLQQAVRL